jgi:hypothetical protein
LWLRLVSPGLFAVRPEPCWLIPVSERPPQVPIYTSSVAPFRSQTVSPLLAGEFFCPPMMNGYPDRQIRLGQGTGRTGSSSPLVPTKSRGWINARILNGLQSRHGNRAVFTNSVTIA